MRTSSVRRPRFRQCETPVLNFNPSIDGLDQRVLRSANPVGAPAQLCAGVTPSGAKLSAKMSAGVAAKVSAKLSNGQAKFSTSLCGKATGKVSIKKSIKGSHYS